MAHRTDVIQVLNKLESPKTTELVIDPICGQKMERAESKHLIFRADNTYYFCSKECAADFLAPKKVIARPMHHASTA